MGKTVLVSNDKRVVRSDQAAKAVVGLGFRRAAVDLGVSESTLRKFLAAEGYSFKRQMTWQVETLPGLENSGREASEGADQHAGTEVASLGVDHGGEHAGHDADGVGDGASEPGRVAGTA